MRADLYWHDSNHAYERKFNALLYNLISTNKENLKDSFWRI